jgi:membrane-bound serine protease (ClpP class)
MEFLQNPNVVYLLLVGGLSIAVLALASPGTGILEIMAIFVMGAAVWITINYNLPINWWAIGLIIAGIAFFLLAVFRTKARPLLAVAVVLIVVGSAFFFHSDIWFMPALNPVLTTIVSILSGLFFWVAGRKSIEASLARPAHDLEGLYGQVGEAKTNIHSDGTVQVNSELWSARSEEPIKSGETVRVIGREGFTLLVEPTGFDKSKETHN